MEIQISEMTLSDFNDIKDILTTEFDDFWNKKILEEELKNPSSKYLVAKQGTEIVGFAGLRVIIDEAEIMNIVIKKSFRNQGIGSLILKNLINICIELNLNLITLEVNEENSNAIYLYEKFGFKKVSIRKNYYKSKTAIIMQLFIPF